MLFVVTDCGFWCFLFICINRIVEIVCDTVVFFLSNCKFSFIFLFSFFILSVWGRGGRRIEALAFGIWSWTSILASCFTFSCVILHWNLKPFKYMLWFKQTNRDVTRMEIFISLIRLLEQTAKSSDIAPFNDSSNDTMTVHQFQEAASIPATGRSHG